MTTEEQKLLFSKVRDGMEAAEHLRSRPNDPDAAELLRGLVGEGLKARETLFNYHLRLIWMLIRRREQKASSTLSVTSEDMFQDGSFGLMRAIEKFDPDRGVKFASYACPWILQAMVRAHQRDGLIRIPCYVHDKYAAMEKSKTGSREDLPRVEVILDATATLKDGESDRFVDLFLDEESAYLLEVRREAYDFVADMPDHIAYLFRRHYLEGVSITDLADERKVTRQAVSLLMRNYVRSLQGKVQ